MRRNLLKGTTFDEDDDEEDGPPTMAPPFLEPQPSKIHSGNYQNFWSARESHLLKKLAASKRPQLQSTKQSYTASLVANNYSNLIRTKTAEEEDGDSELLALYKKYGPNWTLIA